MFEAKPVPLEALGVTRTRVQEFALVPQSAWEQFPTSARLLLVLHLAYRAWPPDSPGGWYKVTGGVAARAGLQHKDRRARAVARLATAGTIEVRKSPGRATLVRLKKPGPKRLDRLTPTTEGELTT